MYTNSLLLEVLEKPFNCILFVTHTEKMNVAQKYVDSTCALSLSLSMNMVVDQIEATMSYSNEKGRTKKLSRSMMI